MPLTLIKKPAIILLTVATFFLVHWIPSAYFLSSNEAISEAQTLNFLSHVSTLYIDNYFLNVHVSYRLVQKDFAPILFIIGP